MADVSFQETPPDLASQKLDESGREMEPNPLIAMEHLRPNISETVENRGFYFGCRHACLQDCRHAKSPRRPKTTRKARG